MTTVMVTVAVEVDGMPPTEARAHALWLVGRKGLTVERAAVRFSKTTGKTFVPKSGKPGSMLARQGRTYQVWALAPGKDMAWVVPVEAQAGDAPVYLLDTRSPKYAPVPKTATGGTFRPEMEVAA